MNVLTYDGESCWICSTPGSFCDCEFTHSPWSASTSQASFCASDAPEEPTHVDVHEPALRTNHGTTDEQDFLADSFDHPDFQIDDTRQCGSQQPYARASTPKNNDWAERWTSPGAIAPPNSSSPVGLDTDSSPFVVMPVSCRGGHYGVDRRDGGPWRFDTPFNHSVDFNAPIFPTTTASRSLPRMGSSMSAWRATQGPPKRRDVGRTAVERTIDLERHKEIKRISAPRNLVPISRKRAPLSDPTTLDLAIPIPTELEPSLSLARDTVNEEPHRDDATTTNDEIGEDDGISIISASFSEQATTDNCLKRRRSSVDGFLESKKVKHDRTQSHVSCASISGIIPKYKATKPASMRRAQSLKSEISACSSGSKDSLFYTSPLDSLTSRPWVDKEYPPTEPSTPLPNSVDYARSKANPLVRTLVVYRHRSLEVPKIPKVPIIAPPLDVQPTVVHSAEDHAISRLEALLLREHLERERDGLNVHDAKRTERLKEIYRTDLSFSRRDSATTVDSSVGWDRLEEESTRSTSESQDSQTLAPTSVNIQVLAEQHRQAGRETWINAFGIADEFRTRITMWILKEIPKEPVASEDDERFRGLDLYDQLTNSHQTRFHAAQLFHRYFLSPEKVEYWREAYKYEYLEWEAWGSGDESDYEKGVWDLAVACIALSVKFHRDCLFPLRPVFAAEFLELAPHFMAHETFELAQRDVLYTFRFQLGSCTPQDVLDELWNALPTLRKAASSVGWTAVQSVTWNKLLESLLEPDMLQYPVTLLTAAALVESLASVLVSQYSKEAKVCRCQAVGNTRNPERVLDDIEPTSWQVHVFDANQLVDDVILDVKDVLHVTAMELDDCRKWLNRVGQA